MVKRDVRETLAAMAAPSIDADLALAHELAWTGDPVAVREWRPQ